MNNIWLAFITGLTTGSISCLAVQGGLLTTSIAQSELEEESTRLGRVTKVGSFLIAKIIVYSTLGFGLGLLGSSLVLTPNLLGWMQIFAGLFMLGTAGRLLNLHPVFRYFQIQPPKFVYRILRSESKSKNVFAPAMLGFLTVLIPCGVTQAMMALAIASANPFFGTGIMFAFTLGTSPVFLALGLAATKLLNQNWFKYAAATVIIIPAIVSIEAGQTLKGSPYRLANFWKALNTNSVKGSAAGVNSEGKQEVVINVTSSGYKASSNSLKVGVPVRLTLKTNDTQGCSRSFNIPTLKITKILPTTGSETIEFTPTTTGKLLYTCSMGMYAGEFDVITSS